VRGAVAVATITGERRQGVPYRVSAAEISEGPSDQTA